MWENLKAGIASVIRTNNNNEITGANLQSVLNNIVNTVGANATFAGMATPNTNPGSPDGPVFYFTQGPGLYVNFGNLQIDDNIVILANLTGVWQNLGPLVYESFTPSDKSKLESIESGAEVNVQSDWNQTNDSEDDYIKNKPEVYTKTEIDQKLAGNVKREIVSELPQTGVDGTIYMVPSATAATGDVYDEYMWLSTQGQVVAHFEKIGTTKADLANYYTKSEVDTALGNKQNTISISTNSNTPADNDTVIMQASGTTNTTTFLRRTMSKIWDYIKGKADNIYTQKGDTYTVNMSADANHQGTNEYRVLATLATADCCILNITKTIYGYPAQNTVWFANQNAMSLISLSDFGFVAIGGRSGQSADLCVPVLPTGHPAVEYKIQIVRSTDSESVTFPSSATYKTYSRPMKANVVMRDEISTDAVTFNVTGGTGSVSLEDSNDFIGNVTDASTAAGITVTNYEQGQCYRFTFTEELEGVTLYSSNSVALCTVNETIQKGDVLTFTSVSNTAGGWMYSKTGASIKSSDGSVGIEWENGVADLSVEKVPFNNLVNNAMFQEGDSPYPLAVGEGSEAIVYTGDSEYPYAYSETCSFAPFTVDGGESVFYLDNATSGTTYTIVANNKTQSFTAEGGGKIAVIKVNNNSIANELTTSVPWIIGTQKIAINQIQRIGTSYYFIIRFTYGTAIYENSFIACFIKKYKNTFYINTALGYCAQATGSNATALGYYAKATGSNATALGYNAQATGSNATALGYNAQATGSNATALGYNAQAAYSSGDSTYPRYVVKRFTAIDFIEGGETKKLMFVNYGSSVTISLSGNSITLIPPNRNCKLFIIVNNSVADRIYRSITPYAKVNDIETYITNLDEYDIKTEAVNGNAYYALWMNGSSNNFPSTVSSFSFLAYYKNTSSDSYQISIGHQATAIYNNSIAIGVNTRAVKSGQIVIGAGAIPNENDMLIIGNGSGSANMKGNILTIDDNEVMHVRGIVNEVRTIDTGGTSAIVTQIKQGVLKVTGGGSLELSTTGAVEGLSVKIYASGASVLITNSNINYAVQSGCFHEFIFLDGDWHAQM